MIDNRYFWGFVGKLQEEREAQDRQWGPVTQHSHTGMEWLTIWAKHLGRLAAELSDGQTENEAEVSARLVILGALCAAWYEDVKRQTEAAEAAKLLARAERPEPLLIHTTHEDGYDGPAFPDQAWHVYSDSDGVAWWDSQGKLWVRASDYLPLDGDFALMVSMLSRLGGGNQ